MPTDTRGPNPKAPLWLALYFPHLSLDRLCRGAVDTGPMVISQGGGRHQQVWDCDATTRALGVCPGMRVSAARALVPALQVHQQDAKAESRALARLATWAGQFTSMVSLAPPQALLLEVAGSLTLFGGIKALSERVETGLEALGYRGSLAVAPTPLGAILLARAGVEQAITGYHELRQGVAALPLALLDVSAPSLEDLHKLGLHCVGDCLRLPREGLASRFGAPLLGYLDRILGKAPDPRVRFVPPARFRTHLDLPAEVIACEALLFASHRLLLELAGFLRARQSGVQTVTLALLHGQGCPPTPVTLNLVAPSGDAAYLWQLLRERLERLSLPLAVEAMVLEAGALLPLLASSHTLFGDRHQQRQDWHALADRLRARLGMHAVHGMEVVADHRPEKGWRRCELGKAAGTPVLVPRPLWLINQPHPLTRLGDSPAWHGQALTLQRGPERIESGWWDGEDMARDYFVAADPHGSRLWVFRQRRAPRDWFLHGVFG